MKFKKKKKKFFRIWLKLILSSILAEFISAGPVQLCNQKNRYVENGLLPLPYMFILMKLNAISKVRYYMPEKSSK